MEYKSLQGGMISDQVLESLKSIMEDQRKEKIIHFGGIRGITGDVPLNQILKGEYKLVWWK